MSINENEMQVENNTIEQYIPLLGNNHIPQAQYSRSSNRSLSFLESMNIRLRCKFLQLSITEGGGDCFMHAINIHRKHDNSIFRVMLCICRNLHVGLKLRKTKLLCDALSLWGYSVLFEIILTQGP